MGNEGVYKKHYNHNLMTECASRRVLDEAYDWLRSARSTTHSNNLFWSFTFNWAVYLQPLDAMAQKDDLAYVRYMDDFVIFAKTRHQLRKIIKRMYAVLKKLGLKLAKAKTWLGRVVKGISFLGYEISPSGIDIAQRSFDRMLVRFNRLYEQGVNTSRLIKYVRNWIKWARSGVSLNVKELKLKTTTILQDTYNFLLPLKQ